MAESPVLSGERRSVNSLRPADEWHKDGLIDPEHPSDDDRQRHRPCGAGGQLKAGSEFGSHDGLPVRRCA
jgi:hypothetical protein